MPSAPARPWSDVLRDLRRAAGISQEGWAAKLEYGRRTVQRWEMGSQSPDARAAGAIIELCRQLSLFRTYRSGSLAGLTVDAVMLEELLAEARVEAAAGDADSRAGSQTDRPHNLARPLTALVGRDWEAAELAKLVGSSGFVTITGIGGVGKTRLAVDVAWRSLPRFGDGAWFVPLADIGDPALLPLAVGQALGIRESSGLGVTQSIIRNLRDCRLVLVLDNCEQVGEVAAFAAQILGSCPGIHILTTSRERIGVPGEITWPLAPLITPSDGPTWTADEVEASDAVRLFVDRAREVRPDFRVTDGNAPAVAGIVRRLDGLPLAIELAAGRMSVLTPSELETNLRDRLDLLSSASLGVPARHRTLTAALDWSWGLLNREERELLAQLSVFVDGWSLDGLASVCRGGSLEALARLVDVSLVTARPDERSGGTRYRLLETVRAYAASKLAAEGAVEAVEDRLAAWCVERARAASNALHGADQARSLAWVEAEHGTIRHVMGRALEANDIATVQELIGALWWAWGVLGRGAETRAWTEHALTLVGTSPSVPPDGLARTLIAAAGFASFAGDIGAARSRLDEAEHAASASLDPRLLALVRSQQTRLLQVSGRFEDAAALATDIYEWAADVGDVWMCARMLEVRAHAAVRRGRPAEARSWLGEAERLERLDGDLWGLAAVLAEIGDLDRAEGQLEGATARYEESLAMRARVGIPGSTPSLVQNLGFVALAAGDVDAGAQRFATAADEFRRAGDIRGVAECIVGLAGVAAARRRPIEAATLLGWARHALAMSGGEIWPSNRRDEARIEHAVRDALGVAGSRRAEREGATMSIEDVVTLVSRLNAEAPAETGIPLRAPAERGSQGRAFGLKRWRTAISRSVRDRASTAGD